MSDAAARWAPLDAAAPLSMHGPLAGAGLVAGLATSALFFLVQGRSKPGESPPVLLSALIALVSSLAWGVGVVFMFLWTGIFV